MLISRSYNSRSDRTRRGNDAPNGSEHHWHRSFEAAPIKSNSSREIVPASCSERCHIPRGQNADLFYAAPASPRDFQPHCIQDMSSVAWNRSSLIDISCVDKTRSLREPSSSALFRSTHQKAMVDQRRPSDQSLVLDLDGLDLGGPSAFGSGSQHLPRQRGHRRASSSVVAPPSYPQAPASHVNRPQGNSIQAQDSFSAHLREDCMDSNQIYSSETVLKAGTPLMSPLSQPLSPKQDPRTTNYAAATSGVVDSDASRSESGLAPGTDFIDLSHQVLGGFASLGLTSLNNSTSNSHLPSLFGGDSFLALNADLEKSRWRSLKIQSCDPMDALDVLSIEEMGQLAVNVGSRDEWDGMMLCANDTASRPSVSSEESRGHLTPVAWVIARCVSGKRRWICAPVESKNTAARTVIVTDCVKPRIDGADDRPHAAFSGLASFELQFLHNDNAPSTTIMLAPPSVLKSHLAHLAGGTPRRRAESLTRSQLASPRRNPSERSSTRPTTPALRRTRSRPAIKMGTLNRPQDAATHEKHLIESLTRAGILSGRSSQEITPSIPHRSSMDERNFAGLTIKTPRTNVDDRIRAVADVDTDRVTSDGENSFPGDVISPFQDSSAPQTIALSEDTSPKSPLRDLSSPYAEILSPLDHSWPERPRLTQTVSELQAPSRFGQRSEVSWHSLSKETLDESSGSKTRKEHSKLTGWFKKRIAGSGSASSSASSSGINHHKKGESPSRALQQQQQQLRGALDANAVLEYSSDVTYDTAVNSSDSIAGGLPQSSSHGVLVGHKGSDRDRADHGAKWPLQNSLLAQHSVGRRASASDDALVAAIGQADRKAALGASEARRPSRDANALDQSAAMAQGGRRSTGKANGSSSRLSVPKLTSGRSSATSQGLISGKNAQGKSLGLSQDALRHGPESASSSPGEDALGLDSVSSDALAMVLPLPLRGASKVQRGGSRLYLRLSFVPFLAGDARHSTSVLDGDGKTTSKLLNVTQARSEWPDTSNTSLSSSPKVAMTSHGAGPSGGSSQWYRRLGRSLVDGHYSISGPSVHSPPSVPTGSNDRHRRQSSDDVSAHLLFGAGPARRSEVGIKKVLNRRTSYVQSFRVTGLVVSVPIRASQSPMEVDKEDKNVAPPLPAPGSFPVVLALCMEEQSLEFVPEGWAALGLGEGPSDDADQDGMLGVADAIIAACSAIMDL
ncbi:unnamed protein product [Sympodiomycopsis kandeliae]